jgi:CHAT domain-containing protein/tetratricopeptide (TPR) repeat protein
MILRPMIVYAGLGLATSQMMLLPQSPGARTPLQSSLPTEEARVLTPGVPIAREPSGRQSHSYQIALEAGQFTVVTANQRHATPTMRLDDPAGRSIVEMSIQEVSIFAETPGRYLIQVRAAAGSYEIRVEPLRPARAQDKARASADRIASEGARLSLQATEASTREAIEKFRAARALFREAEHPSGEALTLIWMGRQYLHLENGTQPARDHFNQALALARSIDDRAREAEALVSLGGSYTATSADREKALAYLEQALTLFEAVDDRRGQAVVLTNFGDVWLGLRQYQKALDGFERALALAGGVDDRAQAARINNYMGIIHQNLGDLPKALEFYNRAIPLSREGGALRNEFMVIGNAGIVYKELGDYRKALDAYNQSLELARKLDNVYGQGMVLNSIGTIHRVEGNSQTSLDYYNQALAFIRRLKLRGVEAAVLNNMGAAYAQMGAYQEALEHHQQSRDIRKALGDRLGESSSLNRAGAAFHKLGDLEKANEYLREALEIRRQIHDPLGEAETLLHLAAVERDRSELAQSQATLEAALEITESMRARIADAALRASYIARVQETYESYVDLLMRLHAQSPSDGHDAAALRAAERTRARVLLESLVEARANIRQGVDAALLDRERSLQQQLDTASLTLSRGLAAKAAAADVAAARKALENLTGEYQQLQAQIRAASPRYAALTQPEPLNASQIQQDILDNETVLLEFALGEQRSWLWAVTRQTLTSVALPSRGDLEAAARSLYAEVTARQPRDGETGAAYARRVAAADGRLRDRAEAVSRMLFSGILAELQGPWRGKRLVIVAAGALEYLPFAALPLPQPGDRPAASRTAVPLIARHEIVEAPSASVLATLRRDAARRKLPRRTVAVLADPVFDAADPRVARAARRVSTNVTATRTPTAADASPEVSYLSSRALQRIDDIRGGLTRLPFSRDEANAITSLAGGDNMLRAMDFEAARTAVLGAELEDYRIVHFATHGLIDADRPELSGLVLSLVSHQGQPQDGFLRLHDIYNMRLNADLVVLSACQTALGKEIKGEGLVGLTRGFMYAGAPRVVASLWQVSDLATAELMKRFYTGMFKQNLTPAAALRAAQLQMAKDPRWSSPYFWAGFVLQGDWK